MTDLYSPLKATRYLDRIEKIRRGEPVGPVHVQIILSDLCNHACSFCAYRDPGYTSSTLFYAREDGKKGLRYADHPERNYNPNRMLPLSKVVEVLDDCVEMGVKAIQFTGGGEPTVHPDFARAVDAVVERGLKWSLVTNGVNLTRKGWIETCRTASWVRVSLDAGTPSTYSMIRQVPDTHWLDALAAVEGLSKLDGPVVGVGFVVTPDNWCEVFEGAAAAKMHGADNIRIGAQFSAQDEALFAEFHGECAALCREAEVLSDDTFQVYNRFGEKLDDLKQGRPDYPSCGYQQFTTYVGGDMNLYRCCVYAYHPHGLYGSIKDRRFKDVWMEQARADAMRTFDATGCERCQFNKINSTLEYLLRAEDPEHSEFV
jgi:MoaA/NifB/PqqE/SkfB family radical SAM enzyme